MAPTGSWASAPKDAFIVGLKELPDTDDPVTHRHIFYAHAYKVLRNIIRYIPNPYSRSVRVGGLLKMMKPVLI